MVRLVRAALLRGMTFLGAFLCFGQSGNFDIVIARDHVEGNLVYGSISLNGQTLGNAFENNDLKIPAGTCTGLLRYDSGHHLAQGPMGELSNNGDFLLEVAGVPGRTNILLHQGNLPRHSKGCVLLGPANKGPDGGRWIDKEHPLYKLRLAFYGTEFPDSTPDKTISITITDRGAEAGPARGSWTAWSGEGDALLEWVIVGSNGVPPSYPDVTVRYRWGGKADDSHRTAEVALQNNAPESYQHLRFYLWTGTPSNKSPIYEAGDLGANMSGWITLTVVAPDPGPSDFPPMNNLALEIVQFSLGGKEYGPGR